MRGGGAASARLLGDCGARATARHRSSGQGPLASCRPCRRCLCPRRPSRAPRRRRSRRSPPRSAEPSGQAAEGEGRGARGVVEERRSLAACWGSLWAPAARRAQGGGLAGSVADARRALETVESSGPGGAPARGLRVVCATHLILLVDLGSACEQQLNKLLPPLVGSDVQAHVPSLPGAWAGG